MVTSAPSCVTGGCTLEIESDERRRRRSEAAAATMAEARSASVMKACIHSEGSLRGEGEGLGFASRCCNAPASVKSWR